MAQYTRRTVSTSLPPSIDPIAAARWAHQPLAQSPWLHEEVARRMEDRLQWIRLQPRAWLDWMPVVGGLEGHARVAARYPAAVPYLIEVPGIRSELLQRALARPWWTAARWRAPAPQWSLPAAGAVDMVWANMALHASADPQALIAQWHRALATDGFLMLSCLGPDSLGGLRQLYADLGWAPPGHALTDMHDWGDMLVQAGFAEPVMDMERITLTYSTPERLLEELRGLGRNLHVARDARTHGRAWRARLCAALAERLARSADGQLALEFEIIYGHALKPVPRVALGQQTSVPLDDMRTLLRQPRKAG